MPGGEDPGPADTVRCVHHDAAVCIAFDSVSHDLRAAWPLVLDEGGVHVELSLLTVFRDGETS